MFKTAIDKGHSSGAGTGYRVRRIHSWHWLPCQEDTQLALAIVSGGYTAGTAYRDRRIHSCHWLSCQKDTQLSLATVSGWSGYRDRRIHSWHWLSWQEDTQLALAIVTGGYTATTTGDSCFRHSSIGLYCVRDGRYKLRVTFDFQTKQGFKAPKG